MNVDKMRPVSAIAAASLNGIIGNNGGIPWSYRHQRADMYRFQQLTIGHTIIMGRKTFESMDCRQLPNRSTIVITRGSHYKAVKCVSNLDDALHVASLDTTPFIIGGETLFREAWPRITKIYLTLIDTFCQGSVMFPHIDMDYWRLADRTSWLKQDERNRHAYSFLNFERIKYDVSGRCSVDTRRASSELRHDATQGAGNKESVHCDKGPA